MEEINIGGSNPDVHIRASLLVPIITPTTIIPFKYFRLHVYQSDLVKSTMLVPCLHGRGARAQPEGKPQYQPQW
jgi:hypothetical protein